MSERLVSREEVPVSNVSVPDLECREVTRIFGEFRAVDGVSFTVEPGSFFSILGPSGCGKTTLLRMIAGFLEPTSGKIAIKGRDMTGVPPNRRPVSMVFQHLALFPMMDVGRNVGFGLRQQGVPRAEIDRRVADALARVGLPGIERRRIEELSGGQRQRVAIARAMVLEPDLLLLDEPLGALDLKLREHMKVELKKLQEGFGTTFVYITHDQSEAMVMSDKVAVMNNGRFEQVGRPQDLYYRPATAFVAGFVGDANRFVGKVVTTDGKGIVARTDDGLEVRAVAAADALAPGTRVEIFVRPEAVRMARAAAGSDATAAEANHAIGTVQDVLFNGANSRVLARLEQAGQRGGREMDVAIPQTGEYADLSRGERLSLAWAAEAARAYPARADGPSEEAGA